MNFTLIYRGLLHPNGKPKHKQEIRRALHPQLKKLWERPVLSPLKVLPGVLNPDPQDCPPAGPQRSVIENRAGFLFAPLVTEKCLFLAAKIHVLLLRPCPPGSIIHHGGDLDNRLKTLLDALRVPSVTELPRGESPRDGETPFFCLLQDDALVTDLRVETDQLLDPAASECEVAALIRVATLRTRPTMLNLEL